MSRRSHVVFSALLLCRTAYPQGVITTLAGTDWVFPAAARRALAAPLGELWGVAVDRAGVRYISDPGNHMVFRIAADGTLNVVAGNGIPGYSGDGGPATAASLQEPRGIAIDDAGTVYIADQLNDRVRRVTADGIITTVAGTGDTGFSGDGGPATNAALNGPFWVTLDARRNLYITDSGNDRVRRVSADGVITTIAGTGIRGFSGDGGPAIRAALEDLRGIAVDAGGNVWIAANNRIRRITADGNISTFAGDGEFRFAGDGGLARNASFLEPNGVALDASGNLYIADTGNERIRRVGPNNIITTVAGRGVPGFSGDGGPATAALLNRPGGVAVDAAGNLYIADTRNYRLRRADNTATIATLAGNGFFRFSGDGAPAVAASLNTPLGVALDRDGNAYVADSRNHRIRRVGRDGIITTVAGSGVRGFAGDGAAAAAAWLSEPQGVALDAAGNLYIADTGNDRIRRVTPAGIISTAAGAPPGVFTDPDGVAATNSYLESPTGVAFDASGNFYIAVRNKVRRVDRNGIITTIAGTGEYDFSGDGGPARSATFRGVTGVALDGAGNLYIVDQYNARIRRVNPAGIISTVAGNGIAAFSGDGGPAASASLNDPFGVATDVPGNLYIADVNNHRVRRVAPSGIITTVAGAGEPDFSGDGGSAAAAALHSPSGVALDAAGNLFIADTDSHRLRLVLAAPGGSIGSPSFALSAESLSLRAQADGLPSAAHTVRLTGSLSGLPFLITLGAPWLRATPVRGSMPAAVQITADPAGLSPGNYQTTITVTSPNANPSQRAVAVTLVVEPAAPPRLALHPDALSFSFVTPSRSAAQTFSVVNEGGGSLPFAATVLTASGGEWLSVTPTSGTATRSAPVSLTVRVDPARLTAGTYTGRIFPAIETTGEAASVAVTVTVTAIRQSIRVSQAGLAFVAVAGGGVTPSQTFGVLNTGQGAMEWSAFTSTLSGGPGWLAVRPAAGSSDAASARAPLVDVSINAASLAPGDYYGQVAVAAAAADNSPQIVPVVLSVLPAGSNPGPVVRPVGLVFAAVVGSAPGSQEVLVYNPTAAATTYASSRVTLDGGTWLVHVPMAATVSPERPVSVLVQSDQARLQPGVRRGALTLLFTDGSIRTVSVLSVVAGASGPAAPGLVGQAACRPTRLLPIFTLLADGFSVPANWPSPLDARIVDDCGNPMNTGSVIATFSNGDAPVSLAPLGDGNWSGTWQPRSSRQAQVTVSVTAESSEPRIAGTTQQTGALRENPNPPVISPGGIVSSASFSSRTPLAPGGLISIFGSRLAEAQNVAPRLPLGDELAGTVVLLAGRPLRLLYVGESQINALIPYDVPVNARHQVIVRRRNTYTLPEPVTVAAAQPAIFTKGTTGRGQGVIVNSTFQYVEPGNAARAGDAVVIYCSGLGAVEPPVPAGVAAPTSPLSRTVNPVSVTIGGSPAEVFFAGLAPGFAGLYQINAFVPQGVTPGDAVDVIVTVTGQSSPPVTMAVQ